MSKSLNKFNKKRIKLKQKKSYKFELLYGLYGLKALSPLEITKNQIEALRRVITRKSQRVSRIWIRIIWNRYISYKGTGHRMGKGKGSVRWNVGHISIGQIFLELTNISNDFFFFLFKNILKKLWFKILLIKKNTKI